MKPLTINRRLDSLAFDMPLLTHRSPANFSDRLKLNRICAREENVLEYGMDFRRPEYRREVFLRLYEYNLRYRVQPGAVHYTLPFMALGQEREETLWMLFLAANTMNVVTAWVLWQRFPSLKQLRMGTFTSWFTANRDNLGWDTDRRFDKKNFLDAVSAYRDLMRARYNFRQSDYYATAWGNAQESVLRFQRTWEAVRRDFKTFGRMTTFSFLEQLRVVGEPYEGNSLYLEDIGGSRSHRNGLCKVLGRDDLDWHKSNPRFDGRYSPQQIDWLNQEAATLLTEARARVGNRRRDTLGEEMLFNATYLTLESTLCTYKGCFRKNRRYPNAYSDILYDRVRFVEERTPREDVSVFWKARKKALPAYLRLEDNPNDPGAVPVKQNHFLATGEMIMLERDWPCFRNAFTERVAAGEFAHLRRYR